METELRDKIAIEAMNVFMQHQGDRVISPIGRIMKFLGIRMWKQDRSYNFNDIANSSYTLADKMLEVRGKTCTAPYDSSQMGTLFEELKK